MGLVDSSTATEVRIPLDQLSVAADSGWRDLDPIHVAELEMVVRSGRWGQTTLARPSVLEASGRKVVSLEDGRFALNNGLHAIKALQNVAKAIAKMQDGTAVPVWVNEELKLILADGVLVDLVEYSTSDRSARCVAQAIAHEHDQNRCRPATLMTTADIVMQIYNVVRSWAAVTKQLQDALGERSTVFKWVTLARDLDRQILVHIQKTWPTLPQDFVCDNPFLVGRGEWARFRLTPPYAIVAITWLRDHEEGPMGTVSAGVFEHEMCLPAKVLEAWECKMIKLFGAVLKHASPSRESSSP